MTLAVDHHAAEATAILRAAGLRVILLKGAVLATWLYDDGTPRPYGDADLLVAPGDFADAERALAGAGFVLRKPGLSPLEEVPHARTWIRNGAVVDLHHRLSGVGASPERAWALLCEGPEFLTVGAQDLEVLGPPARAFHVALHAAQHGVHEAKPLEDLRRAIARLPLATWRAAADLAGALDASDLMATGLGLVPGGAGLAAELGLPAPSRAALLRATSTTKGIRPVLDLAHDPLRWATLGRAFRLAIPTPTQVRLVSPLARRSRAVLVLVYAWVPLRRAWRLPGAVVEVVRARWPRVR
jgi:hypothetical protein